MACHLFGLGVAAGGAGAGWRVAPDRPKSPNIVFVLGDDVGNNDVGWHNPEAFLAWA